MKFGLLRNEAGSVAIITALVSVVVLVSAGVAIDYVRLADTQNQLQTAADTAALTGAALLNGTADDRRVATEKSFTANLTGNSLSASPPEITFGASQISVVAVAEVDLTLMQLVGLSTQKVQAKATAVWEKQAPCILSLEPSDKEAIVINSDSKIDAPDCQVQINSANSEALYANSGGDIFATGTCVNGGWNLNSGSTVSPLPVHCPAVSDPLASLPYPTHAGCDYNDLSLSGTLTLSPGVYCGKLELNAGADVTFQPGVYIKKNGEFIVNSDSRAFGQGVMFFFTGNNNSRFNINSNSNVDFKAPVSGPYAGIVFFQERNIAGADFSILNSGSTSKIEGVIYLPSTPLHLNSFGSLTESSPWTIIIADKLHMNSGSILRMNANYAVSSVPVPVALSHGNSQVRLVE